MTRWVQFIHFEIDHRELRGIAPVNMTATDLDNEMEDSEFVEVSINPDDPYELAHIRADRIVAYRTHTEQPSSGAPEPVDGVSPEAIGTWRP